MTKRRTAAEERQKCQACADRRDRHAPGPCARHAVSDMIESLGIERAQELAHEIAGKGTHLHVRVAESELGAWGKAAKAAGVPLSAWVRARLNAAAQNPRSG